MRMPSYLMKRRDRPSWSFEGAKERCRQERAFKLSKGVDPATLPPEEEARRRRWPKLLRKMK